MKTTIQFAQTICLDKIGREYIKPSVSGEFDIPDNLINEAVIGKPESDKASKEIVHIYKRYEALILQIYERTKEKNERLHFEQKELQLEQKEKEIEKIDFDKLVS